MTGIEHIRAEEYIELSADIVSAFVSQNSIPASELGNLLASVHAAITGLVTGGSTSPRGGEVEKATPAQIRKSIMPDALISFEDGKRYKTLRRHLALRGLTPEQYRAKWGLSPTYPIVCAEYSAERSKLARSFGLGQPRKGGRPDVEAKNTQLNKMVSETSIESKPKRAGRPRKTATAA